MRQPQARLCRGMVNCLMDFQKISGKILIHIHSVLDFFHAPIMNLYLILSTPTPHSPQPQRNSVTSQKYSTFFLVTCQAYPENFMKIYSLFCNIVARRTD